MDVIKIELNNSKIDDYTKIVKNQMNGIKCNEYLFIIEIDDNVSKEKYNLDLFDQIVFDNDNVKGIATIEIRKLPRDLTIDAFPVFDWFPQISWNEFIILL